MKEQSINRPELRHRIAWQISWPKYTNQFLTDKNYENYYQQNASRFDGTELKVSQILIHTSNNKQTEPPKSPVNLPIRLRNNFEDAAIDIRLKQLVNTPIARRVKMEVLLDGLNSMVPCHEPLTMLHLS